MFDFLLQLIYPNVCGVCGSINKHSLCKECELKLKKIETTNIYECKNKYLKKHAYIFKYTGEIRKMFLNYKFNDSGYLYKTFSRLILNNAVICSLFDEYDFIIPVPLHKKRLNSRGYNQSELIMKDICRNLKGLIVEKNILIKIKNTVPQSTLNKNERMKNIKEVYTVKNKERIYNKKILLFDDIYTTGSTANECARVLIENGAKEVGILTIAKD